MLPSQNKRYRNLKPLSDEVLSIAPIGDPSLSRNDSFSPSDSLLIHETKESFNAKEVELKDFLKKEKRMMYDPETDSFKKVDWEYCERGFGDCGKSCPVENCKRNV